MLSGETFNSITVKKQSLHSLGKKVGISLSHIGILDVDCIIDSSGDHFILDMNARFGGLYPFSHIAGANIPKAIIKWLKSEDINPEIYNVRYGIEGFKDINPVILKRP